jgi:hypothetical protein
VGATVLARSAPARAVWSVFSRAPVSGELDPHPDFVVGENIGRPPRPEIRLAPQFENKPELPVVSRSEELAVSRNNKHCNFSLRLGWQQQGSDNHEKKGRLATERP